MLSTPSPAALALTTGLSVLLAPSQALADKMYSAVGNALFKRIWSTRASSVANSDGLGPLFNTRSCHACHPSGNGSGGLKLLPGEKLHDGFALKMIPTDPHYGNQLQPSGAISVLGEGTLHVSAGAGAGTTASAGTKASAGPSASTGYDDGQQTFAVTKELTLTVKDMNYGPITSPISLRMAPRLYMKVLRGQVPLAQLKAWADPEDRNKDGVSGRIRWRGTKDSPQPGMYGWRGDAATLLNQVADAFHTDMGLSSRLHEAPAGDCTPYQKKCRAVAGKPMPEHEVTDTVLNYTTRFSGEIGKADYRSRYSAKATESPAFKNGLKLFMDARCGECHQPTFVSKQGKTEYLFSDGLLHDMGEALADPGSEQNEERREWLTPPLTGIGYFAARSKAPLSYLHDGRVRSIDAAILAHDGEGEAAKKKYQALAKPVREQLVEFIKTL